MVALPIVSLHNKATATPREILTSLWRERKASQTPEAKLRTTNSRIPRGCIHSSPAG